MKLTAFKIFFQESLQDFYTEDEVLHFLYLLVEFRLKENRFVWVMQPDYELLQVDINFFESALEDLKRYKPIQYITGHAYFGSLTLKVSEGVLIPRPETLELVNWACDCAAKMPDEINILEVGTGSGCIPISLSMALPKAAITALDVSEKALKLAAENALTHQRDIAFVQADVLELNALAHSFDMIISNPPYVREQEKVAMSKNVLDYEPEIALFVTDDNPLLFYRKIAQLAYGSLTEGGLLFFEINEFLGIDTLELLSDLGFNHCELRKDVYGKNRMIKAIK
ncbi:MAG: peptide chain release factor N(5)-glutamine methyltransferase [Flavobacteriia bacterium]|nr:peptide chain release factor N(5)-glutamine methyltransferase [Flavobacteriia bacterium]